MSGRRDKRDHRGPRQQGHRPPHSGGKPDGRPQGPRRDPRAERGEQRRDHGRGGEGRLWLYGQHAVEAALVNPRRYAHELRARADALSALGAEAAAAVARRGLHPRIVENDDLAALLPPGAVHQGLALRVEPLDQPALEELDCVQNDAPATILLLDQVTDPQNVGAILRSAAAFGASAVITQDRHSPPESGALARAASGALEVVPWIRTVNISRTLDQLAERGFWRIGLDGAAEQNLPDVDLGARIVLILGAEGAGLRPGTQKHCDLLARLPITRAVESLNVSNAAAVALYEFARRKSA